MKPRFALCAFFSALPLFAGPIQEVESLSQVDPLLRSGDLLVLDIDNTLVVPCQQLGSDQWFYHRLNQLMQAGMENKPALEQSLRDWHAVQALTKVRPCESCSADWVQAWQSRGMPVMGLTTRGLGLSQITIDQLESLKIDLKGTAPVKDERFYLNPWGVLLRRGILFTAGTHKGRAFMKFLDDTQMRPQRVVFVNDKASHLKELQQTVEERGIDFLGLRYGAVDGWVRSFDPSLTEVQWRHFGSILSDAEAKELLQPCPHQKAG